MRCRGSDDDAIDRVAPRRVRLRAWHRAPDSVVAIVVSRKRKIEPYIYEVTGKHTVSYQVEIEHGNSLGRLRSLDVARRLRDEHLAKYGEAPRLRRRLGTGGINPTPGGRLRVTYDGRHIATRDTVEECEALLRDYIGALPPRTWHSGKGHRVARTLPHLR